jgi:hypothetical protein
LETNKQLKIFEGELYSAENIMVVTIYFNGKILGPTQPPIQWVPGALSGD